MNDYELTPIQIASLERGEKLVREAAMAAYGPQTAEDFHRLAQEANNEPAPELTEAERFVWKAQLATIAANELAYLEPHSATWTAAHAVVAAYVALCDQMGIAP